MTAASPTPPSRKGTPSKKFGPGLLLGTAAVAAFIGLWEGGKDRDGSSVAYADKLAGGLPTVCAGLTRHITSTPIVVGERWSAEKCLAEEQKAITTVQLRLEQCFRVMPPQSVFDAATSHAWNNGTAATCGSLAMQAWNGGEDFRHLCRGEPQIAACIAGGELDQLFDPQYYLRNIGTIYARFGLDKEVAS